MIILGVHDGHNASICLYKDGKILAALQEERILRKKNWAGIPAESIEWALQYAGIKKSEIDIVSFSTQHMFPAWTKEDRAKIYRESGTLKTKMIKILVKSPLMNIYTEIRKNARVKALEKLGFDKSRIKFMDHHLSHASAAYYGYGVFNEDVLVLTNDGSGDGLCATVNIGRNGKLETVETIEFTQSLGNLYALVTFMTGMVPLEHEYKLMGMAPYADPKGADKICSMLLDRFEFDPKNPMKWRRKSNMPHFDYQHIRDMFEFQRFDWIMGGIQKFTEIMLTQWVKNCVTATGIHKVVLSGGIFMNVKANKCIMELDAVKDLFVFPSCADETNSIGACYYQYAMHKGVADMKPLEDMYFGPGYDDAAVEKALNGFKPSQSRLSWEKIDNIEAKVAELLHSGQVVARFAGREEFGARSLGNRAILGDPSRTDIIKIINGMIKCRDFWMPFACSILEERASDYLVNPKNIRAPYMILSFDTTSKVKEITTGTHPYDNTVRPQVVLNSHSPRYHKQIREFEKLSGIGAVLNTSFNLHGFPIVHTPQDALDVLDRSGLKYLALENYLVAKA